MAGVEDVLGSPLSPCWCPELDAVPTTVPSSPDSWARGAKAWTMLMEDLSCVSVRAAGSLLGTGHHSQWDKQDHMGRELGTSPYLLT